jgi:K+-sensing histidine kinase KdpD
VVACVCPNKTLLAGAEEESDDPQRQAASILEAARDVVGDLPADFRTVVSTSPARGLAELAEEEGVEAVVVGSTHRGPVGRVMSGSTAERLLHGSGCPVAVALRGYRRHRSKPSKQSASPSSTLRTGTKPSASPPTSRQGPTSR